MKHGTRHAAAVPAAILVILLAGCPPGRPTLQRILDRNVEALGGREAIRSLGGRLVTGRQIDDRPYAGPPVTSRLEAAADARGRWVVHLTSDGGTFSEGCDARGCWRREADGPSREQERTNARLAYLLDPQGPLRIERHFPNLRLTGTRILDGVAYWMVENDLEDAHYTLYFEIETGLLSRIGFHWRLEDFRAVDGVLVPGTVVRGRKGGSTNLYFDEVAHAAPGDLSRDAPGSRGRNR